MNFQKDGRRLVAQIFDHVPDPDGVLQALGLERRRSAAASSLPVVGTFVAGLVLGTGVAIWLYPRFGAGVRQRLEGLRERGLHALHAKTAEPNSGERSVENGRATLNHPSKVSPIAGS
jgi:hypothetical protein